MIIKLYSITAFTGLILLSSCGGNNNKDYVDKSIITPEAEKRAAAYDSAAGNINTGTATPVIPGIVNPAMQATPVAIGQSGTVTGNINPAHGQPGHRCDIAVGAPLDSKPAPANVQQVNAGTTPSPSPVTITQVPTLNKTAPGMNPAHGEPGHRCDIAVGAPLDSKPAANNASQPNVVTTQQPAQNVVTTQQPAAVTLPGMNPPHGEPGHRCDIAVGAPLNSKPAAANTTDSKTTSVPPLLAPVKPDSLKN